MKNSYDQIKIEYSATDPQASSVKIVSIFLILVFAFIPLAEVVTDLDYYQISYQSNSYTCIFAWDSFEPLSFKEIK